MFLSYLDQLTRGAGGERQLVFALVLLVVLIVLPEGLYGGLEIIARALRGKLRRPTQVELPSEDGTRGRAEDTLEQESPSVQADNDSPTATQQNEQNAPLLTLKEVGVSFGGVQALSSVSISVAKGDVHALMGPNGAGKTTLLNCIAGVQRHHGAITFGEVDISNMSPQKIRRAGISRTFQNPSLVSDLTVIENVELGAYGNSPSGVVSDILPLPSTRRRDSAARDAAGLALHLVGIPEDRWSVYATGLTLAEQKLVDIARAMISRPALLLLDEPTAGLHGEEVDHLRDAILRVNRETKVTVVVIAHHVGFLRDIANQATVLNFGNVFASGSPAEVSDRSDVVAIFVGEVDES